MSLCLVMLVCPSDLFSFAFIDFVILVILKLKTLLKHKTKTILKINLHLDKQG